MDIHEDDVVEQAPPSWVLRTPTRRREIWPLPALAVLLAVLLVVVPVSLGDTDPVSVIVGVLSGIAVAAGAVMLAIAGRTAYQEQSRTASWRFHVVGVVLAFGTATILALASLARGHFIGVGSGGLFMAWQVFQLARSVPRFDRLVATVCAAAIALTAATFAVLGVALPQLPEARAAVWIGPGSLVAVVAGIVAVVQFRAARAAPPD
jgi:hypothetical protein